MFLALSTVLPVVDKCETGDKLSAHNEKLQNEGPIQLVSSVPIAGQEVASVRPTPRRIEMQFPRTYCSSLDFTPSQKQYESSHYNPEATDGEERYSSCDL